MICIYVILNTSEFKELNLETIDNQIKLISPALCMLIIRLLSSSWDDRLIVYSNS